MTAIHRQFWIDVLNAIQPQVRRSDFITWFKATALLEREGKKVKVGFPTVIARDYVANKLHSILLAAFQSLDPTITLLEYQVDGTLDQAGGEDDGVVYATQLVESVKKVRKIRNQEAYTVNSDGVRSKALNPRYTIENYIIGPENRLAHAAACAVTKRPGTSYNPLFIYGGVGLGKTHLLQAIGNSILRNFPNSVVAYINAEQFTTEIVEAIRQHGAKSFKDRYRNVDCLILDDVQFLAGKERTQEEFFNTFNALYDGNKQIVLSADRPPKELKGIEDRLISRFEMGMIADVQFPDYETRLAILHTKCREHQVILPPDVLEFIAYNVHHNVRELEGVLLQAVADVELNHSTPTVRQVAHIMKKLNREGDFAVLEDGREHRSLAKTPEDILTIIADYFKLNKSDLVGESRKKEVSVPRQIGMYLMRKELNASYEQIGESFGRNHTTAMHAFDKIVRVMRKDLKVVRDVNAVKKEMGL